ncbi:unnamed protein product [Leptidea sinapis]|uniref:Uncharacterized protein n=1 Tax=Leptidea sinapis TaxID=189913 RepID=A0A5E4Q7Z6_9NEOP|nr:unnamed protein product [Leptidea sinapis]
MTRASRTTMVLRGRIRSNRYAKVELLKFLFVFSR